MHREELWEEIDTRIRKMHDVITTTNKYRCLCIMIKMGVQNLRARKFSLLILVIHWVVISRTWYQTFFVQASKIVVDSWKFGILLIYIL